MQRSLWHLRRSELRVLAVAGASHAGIALLLRFVPLLIMRKRLRPLRGMTARLANADERRAIWALDTIANRFPRRSSCLTRALTAEMLLEQESGIQVAIGVRRQTTGFEAHAWLERESQIILGRQHDHGQVFDNAGFIPIVRWPIGCRINLPAQTAVLYDSNIIYVT